MGIRAGAAAIEITPRTDVPLAGYPGQARCASGRRDPLYASAVHLRGGSGGIIVASLDLHTLDPQTTRTMREAIHEATGIRQANILIGTSQTHSGPVASHPFHMFGEPAYTEPDPAYMELVTQQLVEAASEAAVATQPAAVATLSLGPPHTGAFLVKDTKTNRIASVIVIHNTIPNRLGPEQVQYSSDLVEPLRRRLTAKLGGKPVVAYLPSPVGDSHLEPQVPHADPEAVVEQNGKHVADLIIKGIRQLTAKDFRDDISFAGKLEEMWDLPVKALPTLDEALTAASEAKLAGAQAATGDDPLASLMAHLRQRDARMQLALVQSREAGELGRLSAVYQPTDIQIIRIGGTRLLGMPCSVLPECADMLTRDVQYPMLIAEGVNGDLLASVLSTPSEEGGNYPLISALFHPHTGESIVSYVREFLDDPP